MKKIVTVLGDYYHPHDPLLSFLHTVISLSPEEISLKDIPIQHLEQELALDPDLVIFSLENRLMPENEKTETWLTDEADQCISDYVFEGGALLALHSGLSHYPKESKYGQMLKGRFVCHPEKANVTYTENHDKSYSFLDEHYFTEVEEKETEVFMRSYSLFGESIAGWRHEYGTGRVVCFAPCHFSEGMTCLAFQQTLLESILSCL